MPEMPPLPPWLTRQYDFAGGFRGLGEGYIRGQQLGMLKDKAAEDAALRVQKQVGLRNAVLQANQLISAGVDPLTARKSALLDNAPDAFADRPDVYAHILDSDEADQIRRQANDQIRLHQMAADAELKRYHDLWADAKADTEANRLAIEATRADLQSKRLGIAAWHEKAAQDLKEQGLGLQERRLTLDQERAASLEGYRADRLDQNKRALDIKEKFGGTGKPGPDEVQMMALSRARDKARAAWDSGDEQAAQDAEEDLTNLKKAISSRHPDPVKKEQLTALRQQIANVDKKLGNPLLSDQFPALLAQKRKLIEQLNNFDKTGPEPAPAPAPSTTNTNALQIGRFKVIPR